MRVGRSYTFLTQVGQHTQDKILASRWMISHDSRCPVGRFFKTADATYGRDYYLEDNPMIYRLHWDIFKSKRGSYL